MTNYDRDIEVPNKVGCIGIVIIVVFITILLAVT